MKSFIILFLISFTALTTWGQTYSKTGLLRSSEYIHDFFYHSENQTEKLIQILKIDMAKTNEMVNFKVLDQSHQLTLKNFLIIKEILNLNLMQSIITSYYDRPLVDYYEKLKVKMNRKDFFIHLKENEAKALFQDVQLMLISLDAIKKTIQNHSHKPKFHYNYEFENHANNARKHFVFTTLYTATAMMAYLASTYIVLNETNLMLPKLAFSLSLATYFTFKLFEERKDFIKARRLKRVLWQIDRFKNIPDNTINNLKNELEEFNNKILKHTKLSAPIFCQRLFY
ncbi:MAG: hypothetical protein MK008_09205 [Bdellovibrionales bacterium]|nr:hypothetical protein [Bdellovibrionales bacterium]